MGTARSREPRTERQAKQYLSLPHTLKSATNARLVWLMFARGNPKGKDRVPRHRCTLTGTGEEVTPYFKVERTGRKSLKTHSHQTTAEDSGCPLNMGRDLRKLYVKGREGGSTYTGFRQTARTGKESLRDLPAVTP